jgi:hypothetical protein
MGKQPEYELLNEYVPGYVLMKFSVTRNMVYMHPDLIKVDTGAMRISFLLSSSVMVVYDLISLDRDNDVAVLGDNVAEVRMA